MLDLLVLMVFVVTTCWEGLDESAWTAEPGPVVFVIGMEPPPPLFDVTLKLSMPVMCIFKVLGLPAITLLPLMAEPLLPTDG
jgi:hypothetical protein